LTVFINYQGLVHHKFLPSGQRVNKEYYLTVINPLSEYICRKRPVLWKNNSWFLHHDKTPSHTAMVVREFLAKHSTDIISQAPYSPDMGPCDFFFFNCLKNELRGSYYDTIDIIKPKLQQVLKDILKHEYERKYVIHLFTLSGPVEGSGDLGYLFWRAPKFIKYFKKRKCYVLKLTYQTTRFNKN